jgi:alcohol dehydrogenase class IV
MADRSLQVSSPSICDPPAEVVGSVRALNHAWEAFTSHGVRQLPAGLVCTAVPTAALNIACKDTYVR